MYWSGVGAAFIRVTDLAGAVVLMYHSIPQAGESRWIDPQNCTSVARFTKQMRFLARHRRVIAMVELLDLFQRGKSPRAGTVVLTFDDGYLNNLEVAAPILDALRLPAICYLPTAYVTRGEAQFIDQLFTMFSTASHHELRSEDLVPGCFDLRQPVERTEVYRALANQLTTALPNERKWILGRVSEELQATHRPPRLTMTWDDVRRMRREFPSFEVGVHTAEHIDLRTHAGDIAREDIQRCIADFERELGDQPKHFAFPYNRSPESSRRLVRELGLRSAVTSGRDILVTAASDRFGLPRIQAPHSMTLFRLRTSGACPRLPRALVSRA